MKNEFVQGYMCAVANLIKAHGISNEAEYLFKTGCADNSEQGLITAGVDINDINVFKEHGLL